MPPLPRLRIGALSELARQIRFEPAKAARRQLAMAEALAGEIEPDRTYPEDWVVFRLTGYRAEGEQGGKAKKKGRAAEPSATPTLIVGAALLADLPAFVERLSVAAKLSDRDVAAGNADAPAWLDAAAVCARWKISRKTLDRYRRTGLMARRVIGADARHRLMFARRVVESFESRHGERLRQAGSFSRIDATMEARIVRRAVRYRRVFECSLNQAAGRLARRFGRSQEAVRQLLRRHDARSPAPIFDEAPPVHARERRVIERAVLRGVQTDEVAGRLRTTRASIYHALVLRRAERLRGLDLDGPVGPDFGKAGAAKKYLAPAAVRTGLGRGAPATLADLLDDLALGRIGAADPKVEGARAAAYWFLRAEAAGLIGALARYSPTSEAVDEIETRLRWGARLKAELVRSQLALAIKSIEVRLERPVTALPNAAAGGVVTLAIDAVIEAMDRFDPFKGGRPGAPAGLALNRAISQWMKGEGARWAGQAEAPVASKSAPRGLRWHEDDTAVRATPRADPASVRLDDWTRRVCAWQAWLEPDARVRGAMDRIGEREREVLSLRLGWGGEAPVSAVALAAARGVTAAQIVRLARRAVRDALAVARAAGGG